MLQHLTMPEDHQEFNKAKDEAALNTGPGEIQLGGTSANAKEKPISAALLDDEAMVKIMPVSGWSSAYDYSEGDGGRQPQAEKVVDADHGTICYISPADWLFAGGSCTDYWIDVFGFVIDSPRQSCQVEWEIGSSKFEVGRGRRDQV